MNMSLVTCCDLSLSVFSVVLKVWRLRGIKKHTGIKKPRETGDFRDPTSARRNAHALRRATYPQHIAKSAIDKTVRCHAPCDPPLSEPTHISSLNPSRPLTASRITVSPSSPKPLARKSILFSALALATPLPRSASAIAFPWAPSSPILFLQTRERVVSTLLKNAKSKTQKRNGGILDETQPRLNFPHAPLCRPLSESTPHIPSSNPSRPLTAYRESLFPSLIAQVVVAEVDVFHPAEKVKRNANARSSSHKKRYKTRQSISCTSLRRLQSPLTSLA